MIPQKVNQTLASVGRASATLPYPALSQDMARKSDGRGNPPGCPMSGGSAIRPYLLQRRRRTFYETLFFSCAHSATISRCRAVGRLGIWMFTLTF